MGWVKAQRSDGIEVKCIKVVQRQPEEPVFVRVKVEPVDESV